MKNRILLSVASVVLLALGACDAVKVPGINPTQPEAETPVTPSEMADILDAAEETGAPAASEAVVPEPEATGDTTDTGETPTVDRDDASVEPETDAVAGTTGDTSTATTETGEPAVDLAPKISLAEINAALCGLPVGAPPTPTVGTVAGAIQVEEPVVGAAAVNGLAATLASFPGIVKLEPRRPEADGAISSGHCGATRIAEHWFVTAAHCVDEPYEELRLIGESASLSAPTAKTTEAQLAVCHAGYAGTANGYANDIALVRLTDEEVEAIKDVPVARYGETLKPLAPANYPAADMAGWGLTSFGGQLSNDLLAANIRIMAAGPSTITVSSQSGAGPCVGDSGGPLYVTEEDGSKTMVGVLSVVEQNRTTGEFCAGDYNGRYTNLQGYEGWISSVITACEADLEACQ